MKNNPLFVDSSRSEGEMICTTIELNGVNCYHGEELFVEVHRQGNRKLRLPMTHYGYGQWCVEVYLQHQQEISYEFFITHLGNEVASSGVRAAKVAYCIQERWSPPQLAGPEGISMDPPPQTEEEVLPDENPFLAPVGNEGDRLEINDILQQADNGEEPVVPKNFTHPLPNVDNQEKAQADAIQKLSATLESVVERREQKLDD